MDSKRDPESATASKHIVPGELAEEGAAILDVLREAARSQGMEADVAILGRGSSKGFDSKTLFDAVLVIGGSAATWLTKHWIETYLWPLVQKTIDRPSRRFIDWLESRLPGGGSGAKEPGDGKPG